MFATERPVRLKSSRRATTPTTAPVVTTPHSSGCEHYPRHCKIIAPCCNETFPCRLCHDAHYDTSENPHKLNRFEIRQIECSDCGFVQEPADTCSKCFIRFAQYYCSICHLWDDRENRQIYHCAECGICRVGPAADYFHCKVCCSCYPRQIEGKHKCIPQAMMNICCVCHEEMFDSVRPVVILRVCGHPIHEDCNRRLHARMHHRANLCPLCNTDQSQIEPPEQPSSEWEDVEEEPENNDAGEAAEPMTPREGEEDE